MSCPLVKFDWLLRPTAKKKLSLFYSMWRFSSKYSLNVISDSFFCIGGSTALLKTYTAKIETIASMRMVQQAPSEVL